MKEETRKNYEDFMSEHGCEPLYAYCEITFCDNGTSISEVTIKLSCDDDDDDDLIFYYCNGLNDLLSMYDIEGVNDFFISSVATFGMEV